MYIARIANILSVSLAFKITNTYLSKLLKLIKQKATWAFPIKAYDDVHTLGNHFKRVFVRIRRLLIIVFQIVCAQCIKRIKHSFIPTHKLLFCSNTILLFSNSRLVEVASLIANCSVYRSRTQQCGQQLTLEHFVN